MARTVLASLGCIVWSSPGFTADDASGYKDLGAQGGIYSVALDVSGDGSVSVGYFSLDDMTYRAFRWTSAGMTDLGTLGGAFSTAYGVNADGTVIVGASMLANSDSHAVRWTSVGMEDLGTLPGGNISVARGVNADGSVVVGSANSPTATNHAFRWTSAGMVDLGTLGGTYSSAEDVNADGSVVVGFSFLSISGQRAFRWTSAGMVDLGTLGGDTSTARGVSADGSVVIGGSTLSNGDQRAFRWTSAGMVDLGAFAGGSSSGFGVNADGSVVVGRSTLSSGSNRAFRWTEASGMVTVEDWLRANGVTVAADFTREANDVSADGNVVVGMTQNQTAYIARVTSTTDGSGLIDLSQYMSTLVAKPGAEASLNMAGTTLNGAHGEPMRNLLDAGRQSFSVTVDGGYDNGATSDGGLGIADFSYGIGLEGGATARLSAGGLYTRQDIDTGGDFRQRGFYVAPEASIPLTDGLHATIGGYYSPGRLDVTRGYLNAGLADYSRGETDTQTWGGKLRLDWLNAFSAGDWAFTPYTSITYTHARLDGYSEYGGSFPASFDSVSDHATVARIGLDGVGNVTDRLRILGKLEAAYRFENETADSTGRIIGLSGFNLSGQDVDQVWLRVGLGSEFDLDKGTAYLSLNASTQGDDPTVWLRSGWKVMF